MPAELSEGTLGVEEGKRCRAAEAPGCWVIISGGSFCPNTQLCLPWKSVGVEPTPALAETLQRLNLEGPSPSEGHVGIKLTVSDLNLSFEHVNTYHHSCISKMENLCSKVNGTER